MEVLESLAAKSPNSKPEHYIIPSEQRKIGEGQALFDAQGVVPPTRPIGTLRRAWESARERTRYDCTPIF